MAKKEPLYPHVPKGKMPDKTYTPEELGPAWVSEFARRKEEILTLLKQAGGRAEAEEYEEALWRAVDAAGLLSFLAHRESVGMPPSPTDRGFFINKAK